MRALFVVPPLTGHVNPTLAVAAALQELGHEVAWAAHPGRVRALLPDDATLLPLPENLSEARFAEGRERAERLRGLAALQFLWEDFLVPLGDAMVAPVREAVEAWAPDLLIVDQQALAGGIVARQLDLPWATTVSTSAGITDEIGILPKVEAWRDALLADLQTRHGLAPVPRPDQSPHAVLVFSTPALVGDVSGFGPHVHFVGPSLGAPRKHVPFPWDALDDRPLLFATLGTVNAERGGRFYRALADAFDDSVQIVLGAPEALLPDPPAHVIRRDYLPLLDLIPRAEVVLCHGGHNTVVETLSHGVPLVILPVKDDQPVVARQVSDAGAGVRLKLTRVRPAKLADAVATVRTAPYRHAAARVRASFEAAGGPARAAAILSALI